MYHQLTFYFIFLHISLKKELIAHHLQSFIQNSLELPDREF